jgi:anti-sigma regulatory factor (Ser/Thr protein kinase)
MDSGPVPVRIAAVLFLMPGSKKDACVAPLRRLARTSGLSLTRFRMPSRRSAIAPTVERILEAVLDVGLSADRRADLAVATAEALSNAAVHGNRLNPRAMVVVTVGVAPRNKATVEVKDAGPGFDYTAVSDPTDPSNLLAPRGRGVFLMRRLVDHLEYHPPGNCVSLTILARP